MAKQKIRVDMDVTVWQVLNAAYPKTPNKKQANKIEAGIFAEYYNSKITIDEAPKALEQITAVSALIEKYSKLENVKGTGLEVKFWEALVDLNKFKSKLEKFIEQGSRLAKTTPSKNLVKAVREAYEPSLNHERPAKFERKHGKLQLAQSVERILSGKAISASGFKNDLKMQSEYFIELKHEILISLESLDAVAADPKFAMPFPNQVAATPQEEAKQRAKQSRKDIKKIEKALEEINAAIR